MENYIDDRLIGMYDILESSDIVMEKFNKDDRQIKKMQRRRFIKYLRDIHPEFNPDEIRNAKTQKEKDRVIQKYKNDYKNWKKEVYKDIAGSIAIDLTAEFLFDAIFG